jgi:tetratricopeptide (TPR) repeat protein
MSLSSYRPESTTLQNHEQNSARASFERAVTFMHAGDFEMAEEMCRNSLNEFPRDANLLVLLGAALVKLERPEDAEHTLSRAAKMFPDFSRAHEGLAEAFIMQGKLPAALDSLDTAAALEPGSSTIRVKRGKVLVGLGRDNDASREFEASFKLTPFREELVKGLQFQRMNNLKEAEHIYRNVLMQDPDNVDALRLLAGVAMRAKQWGDAEVLLKKALGRAPDFYQGWMDLGLGLQEQDRMEEALDAFARARKIKPDRASPYTAAGTTTAMDGRHDVAIELFNEALRRDAGNPGALSGLGHVLKTVGEQDAAIAAYRECIEHNAEHGEAYWSLANLKTFHFEDAEIAAMETHAENEALGDEPRANFLFALGKAHEDRQNFEKAFSCYVQGNRIRREHESYDPVRTADQHDEFINVFSKEFLRAHEGNGYHGDMPIFIVGLPRSGSTLIEQVLASHSQVEGTHELPDLGRVARQVGKATTQARAYPAAMAYCEDSSLREYGADYLRRADRHRQGGVPCFTDKMPNNFVHVGFLHLILPDAKIIDARRHPLDSCLGSFKQLFARGQPFTYDLYEIGEFYLEYVRLMDHWHAVLPDKVLRIQYEEVVADLEPEVKRLLDHCDLPFEEACLRFYETDRAVKTASSEQVRKPIYSTSVQLWRRYEDHLGPLIEVLESHLRQLPKEWQPKSF